MQSNKTSPHHGEQAQQSKPSIATPWRASVAKQANEVNASAAKQTNIATPGRATAAKRGSEDGLCPPQRRGFMRTHLRSKCVRGGSAPIKKEDTI